MAILEPEDGDDDYMPLPLKEMVSKLPLEEQFALLRLVSQLDKIITVGERPEGEKYSGYVRVKESDLINYRNLVRAIVTQQFLEKQLLKKWGT